MVNSILVGLLDSVLGKGSPTARGNYAYKCPFCSHHKKKLEINMVPTAKGENPWHCWVCDAKGKTLVGLFKKLKVDKEKIFELKSTLGFAEKRKDEDEKVKVELPKEFIPLYEAKPTPLAKQAVAYLKKRGIKKEDIIKYNIGYCESGRYENMVIIPSYNENGSLEYFVGRSFEKDPRRKFDAPTASKNIIGFENLINWNVPVILCEGAFDAIAVKRNAIPLFGKIVPKKLMQKIVTNDVKKVYIALDKDAIKDTLKLSEKIMNSGKEVYIVEMDDKDPSEMGFEQFTNLVQKSIPLTFSSFFSLKLEQA
jgi:DNA primase